MPDKHRLRLTVVAILFFSMLRAVKQTRDIPETTQRPAKLRYMYGTAINTFSSPTELIPLRLHIMQPVSQDTFPPSDTTVEILRMKV